MGIWKKTKYAIIVKMLQIQRDVVTFHNVGKLIYIIVCTDRVLHNNNVHFNSFPTAPR